MGYFRSSEATCIKVCSKMNREGLDQALFPRRSVMFHAGRCGSVVLATLLKRNPEIAWGHEIFRPDLTKRRFEQYATNDPVKVLQILMDKMHAEKPSAAIFGFETQLRQIECLGFTLPMYLARLQEQKFGYVIILKRKNFLRKLISALAGIRTSVWHRKINEPVLETRFELDMNNLELGRGTTTLREYLLFEQNHFHILEGISHLTDALQLTYEDDIAEDPVVGYRRVCRFLGAKTVDVAVEYGKTNPSKLSDVITNFQEVETTLRGSQFEWMLYE